MTDRVPSPSFAQSGAEFHLDYSDDSDVDADLRSEVGGSDVYELTPRSSSRERGGSRWEDDRPRLSRRPSASTVASFQLYTPDEEATVRRKFDRKLVVFVALLFMLSFLDRSSTLAPFPTQGIAPAC